MAEFSPSGARLHALIGDAVLDIPFHLIERIEQALADGVMPDIQPALIAHLRMMDNGDGFNGVPWDEPGLPPDRSGQLARVSRNVRALGALMRLLQAAHLARLQGGEVHALGDEVEQALMVAGRELAQASGEVLEAWG